MTIRFIWHNIRPVIILFLAFSLVSCVSVRKKTYATLSSQGGTHSHMEIADDFYYVGTSDIAVYLLRTDVGLVLFDTAYEHMHDLIIANIKAAGFKPNDIQIILNTQAHMDHAGGVERMRLRTQAKVWATDISKQELLTGGRDDFSPLVRLLPFTPVKVVHEFKEGYLEVGGKTLQWYHTPGHTKGCTTWRFEVETNEGKKTVVIVCGLKKLPLTKLRNNSKYPNIVEDYKKTLDVLDTLKVDCDILLSPHKSQFKVKQTMKLIKEHGFSFDPLRCEKILTKETLKIREKIGT